MNNKLNFIGITLALIFLSNPLLSQTNNEDCHCPYPIIFVHGYAGTEFSWEEFSKEIANTWDGYEIQQNIASNTNNINGNVIYSHLNVSEPSTNILIDVVQHENLDFWTPNIDLNLDIFLDDDIEVSIAPNKCIYAASFNVKNFENQGFIISSSNDFLFKNYFENNPNRSNQSALFKQGVGLRNTIQTVLNLTGKSKVILVGHSMGGLAIR